MKHKKGTWVIALRDYGGAGYWHAGGIGGADYWHAGDIGEIIRVDSDKTYLVNFYNDMQALGARGGWWAGEYDVEEIDEATAKALLLMKGVEV